MALFCKKRKLQEAKRPVRAYSTYKSLENTNKRGKDDTNAANVQNDQTEFEPVAAKCAKIEAVSPESCVSVSGTENVHKVESSNDEEAPKANKDLSSTAEKHSTCASQNE